MLNEATLLYVRQHADDDVRMLALRGCKDDSVDLSTALQQIQGRQTAKRKLPTWASVEGIVYPPHLNMEQCSSEQTACYKARLARRLLAPSLNFKPQTSNFKPSLLDLTGGFGVDFAFMSEAFSQAIYVEHNEQLCAIASANFQTLGKNVETHCDDGVAFLNRMKERMTMIFLDPARRDDDGGRTFGIADCTPNVLAIKDQLLEKADYVMLKLSPMLDWRKAVADLGQECVSEVHIVSVVGECKELLVVLQKKTATHLQLHCVNDGQDFVVSPIGRPVSPIDTIEPIRPMSHYLYEPHASIMKAGCFSEVALHFGVSPLSENSHLFISDHLVDTFPGRKFQILAVSSMNKQDLRQHLSHLKQANITTRNFPLSVAQLRKRLKISEGGSTYLFATTLANGNHVLVVCQRV